MHVLTRRVRLTVTSPDADATPHAIHGYAGYPTPAGLSSHYEFAVSVRGEPDPKSGYVLDIKTIDDAVRAAVLPLLTRAARAGSHGGDPSRWIGDATKSLGIKLPGLLTLRLSVSPFLSFEAAMTKPHTVTIRQRFDFAAAHRLHVPSLSDEQNRAVFGKCNNAKGHGHNYQFEPAITVTPGAAIPVTAIEDLCKRVILDRFDHKHLNEDCAEFDLAKGGVNPSVENIARVFFDLLAGEVGTLPHARLTSITVWETDRTSATYPGPG